jgi:hypothetical protein
MNEQLTARPEDEARILLFVDILGFAEITKYYRYRVQDSRDEGTHRSYSRTTEIQRQINCFNRILDTNISELAVCGGTQAMLFSDCAYLVFSKEVRNDHPSMRTGRVATDLMREFIKNHVPVRMGIGKGTFYDMEYLTTTNGKLITSKSRFIGTAVVHAYEAERCESLQPEQCGGKGLRIFIHESAEEDLSDMGRHLRTPQGYKHVKWELDYLYDPRPIREADEVEKHDRELYDNIMSMNAPQLSDGARFQYCETIAALNRMRVRNNRKPFEDQSSIQTAP